MIGSAKKIFLYFDKYNGRNVENITASFCIHVSRGSKGNTGFRPPLGGPQRPDCDGGHKMKKYKHARPSLRGVPRAASGHLRLRALASGGPRHILNAWGVGGDGALVARYGG